MIPIVHPCKECADAGKACCGLVNTLGWTPSILGPKEAERIARHVGKQVSDLFDPHPASFEDRVFLAQLGKRATDLWQVKIPCAFLAKDGCTLQGENRPFCCRMFPLIYFGAGFAVDPWAIAHECRVVKLAGREPENIAQLLGRSITKRHADSVKWLAEAF